MTTAVRYWIILACLLSAGYVSFVLYRKARAPETHVEVAIAPRDDSPPLERFELTDQFGRPFDSDSLHGKVWIGSFFFTNCPGACLQMNRVLSALQNENPASPTQYVSITCDPANDTPQALASYAENLKADPARWAFLTGELKLAQKIGHDFFQTSVEAGTHSDRAFLVDRQGVVRGRFRLTEADQVDKLRRLLAVVEAEEPAKQQANEALSGETL